MLNNYKGSIIVIVIDDVDVPVALWKPDTYNTDKVNSKGVTAGDEVNISILLLMMLIISELFVINKKEI